MAYVYLDPEVVKILKRIASSLERIADTVTNEPNKSNKYVIVMRSSHNGNVDTRYYKYYDEVGHAVHDINKATLFDSINDANDVMEKYCEPRTNSTCFVAKFGSV